MTTGACQRFAVIGTAAVITAGLVTASPSFTQPVFALARVEAVAVQLQAQMTSLLQDHAVGDVVALAAAGGIETTGDILPVGAGTTESLPDTAYATDPLLDAIDGLITFAVIAVAIPLVILLSPILIPLGLLLLPVIFTGVGDITRCGSPFCSFTAARTGSAATAGATAARSSATVVATPAAEPAGQVEADADVPPAPTLTRANGKPTRIKADASPRRPLNGARGPADAVAVPKAAGSVKAEMAPATAAGRSPESVSAGAESSKAARSTAPRASRAARSR